MIEVSMLRRVVGFLRLTAALLAAVPVYAQAPIKIDRPTMTFGVGSPEGIVNGSVGDFFSSYDGTTYTLYVKTNGHSSRVGWTVFSTGGGGGVTPLAGNANQVIAIKGGVETVTLGLPQSIGTMSSPTFAAATLTKTGAGSTAPIVVINTFDELSAGIKIRHGGQSGDGFKHPTAAQSALYVTGLHTHPPANAGGLDLANFYLRYTGDLSRMNGSLENVEINTDLNSVTVAPTQAALGLEVNVNTSGSNSGITFPDVRAIYGDINLSVANGGTITWARALSAAMPSGSSATGNAITNAASIYAFGSGSQGGSVIPTNAYSLYAETPTTGTNKWASYINGKEEIVGVLVTDDYSYLGGLRIKGTDTENTIYQSTGNLGIAAVNGLMTLTNATVGIGLDVNTDGLIAFRNRAQDADVATRAAFYNSSNTSVLSVTSNAIAPTGSIHHVGAGLIKTIIVPTLCTPTCTVTIIPDAAYTYDATGNILVPAGGGTAVTNRAMTFTWDGTKWAPSY